MLNSPLETRAGKAAIVGLYVHQYDIRTDLADAIPWNHEIIVSAEHTEKPAGTGHDDGHHISLRRADLHIGNEPQPAAVGNADDLLAV